MAVASAAAMPRRPRVSTAGLTFHVVNRAAKRVPLFEHEGDYRLFEGILREALAPGEVAMFAYCLMPNHWHLLLSPHVDGALSRMMHWLTTTHARRWQTARGLDGAGAVYQGRFKAIAVGNDHHFLWVARYIERNAVRASMVTRAEDWPWSSLRRRCDGDESWLSEWPVTRLADWNTWVNSAQTSVELEQFRHAMKHGEPFGAAEWIGEVRSQLGLKLRRPRGRPRKVVECPRKMTPDPVFTGS